jgi:hypothetical protein
MDEERRIRFLVSPALFVASLLIGALSDPTGEGRHFIAGILTDGEWSKSLVGLVAGGGVVVFAGGYVFGTITVFFLRLPFLLFGRGAAKPREKLGEVKQTFPGRLEHAALTFLDGLDERMGGRSHEVAFDRVSRPKILERLHVSPKDPGDAGDPNDASQDLYVGAAFDFDILLNHHKGVHQWLFRRWNGFNIAANSISALALSLPAGHLIGIPWSLTWYLSVGIFVVFLWFVMFWAWNDTMNMLSFMAP